jgi:hypothetical protein
VRNLLVILALAACNDMGSPDSADLSIPDLANADSSISDLATSDLASIDLAGICPSHSLPTCVPDQYEIAVVTDPIPLCGPDPRCGLSVPMIGGGCSFPGLACEFFGITVACDCNQVAHCKNDPFNPGSSCDGGI